MFIENRKNDLIYMTSDMLPARHAFTTRFGGVSTGALASLNLGEHRGDAPENVRENYRRLGEIFGVGPDDFVISRQVHKTEVRLASDADRHKVNTQVPYEADGLVTNIPGLPLLVFVADCVPVLLCDPESGVIAAVHCGWRSSVGDILGAAVEKMRALGARPENIRAAIGPSIGFDHFEVGPEVPEAVIKYLSGDTAGLFRPAAEGKTLVDLRSANARRLAQLGLSGKNIDLSDECTMCSPDKYWSHRVTGGVRGSQCAVIILD